MKIAVIGAGGVGGYFGGKLAQAGNDVTFVARGATLEAMRKNGLTVKSVDGDFFIPEVQVTDNVSEIGEVELVVLGVKSWQVREAAEQIQSICGAGTAVLPLQNGVLSTEELNGVLTNNRGSSTALNGGSAAQNELTNGHGTGAAGDGYSAALCGLCRIFSKADMPGVITHFGVNPTIELGEPSNEKSERVLKIQKVFDDAGVNCKVPDDIIAAIWQKFTFICTSGLLVVSNSTYGPLREIPETRKMMIELMTEVNNVAIAKGVTPMPNVVEKTMAIIDKCPYDSNCSLTRDVLAGRPSEIEYQNGTVVRLGEELGVDVPVNRFVYSSILPMEIRARSRS